MTSQSTSGGTPATSLGGTMTTGGRDSEIATGAVATGGVPTGGASTSSTAVRDPCSVTNILSGGTQHCGQSESGVYGSYGWKMYSNQGTGCLTTYENVGAAFGANWDNTIYFWARVGLEFNDTEPYEEHGVLSADFAETHTGTAGAHSYIGVYGNAAWPKSVNTADSGAPAAPVFNIWFYIIEDTIDGSPPPIGTASKVGTIEVDGSDYDVYYTVQKPGNYSVYSIRQTPRHCGHISISDHFAEWADLTPVSVGALRSVSIGAQVEGGTGSVDFTTAELTIE